MQAPQLRDGTSYTALHENFGGNQFIKFRQENLFANAKLFVPLFILKAKLTLGLIKHNHRTGYEPIAITPCFAAQFSFANFTAHGCLTN